MMLSLQAEVPSKAQANAVNAAGAHDELLATISLPVSLQLQDSTSREIISENTRIARAIEIKFECVDQDGDIFHTAQKIYGDAPLRFEQAKSERSLNIESFV